MCSRCLHIETWVPGGEYKRGVRALRKAIWVGKNVKLIGCGGRGEGKTRENIWVNLDFCGMWSSLTFLMVRWPPMQHRKLHFKELREGRRCLIFVLHCPVSNCRGEWPKMPTASLIKPTPTAGMRRPHLDLNNACLQMFGGRVMKRFQLLRC